MLRNTLRFIGTLPFINTQAVRLADYYEAYDPEEALFWHSQAAKQGNVESYYKMGQYYEQKSKTSSALKAYFNGAVRGHAESLAALELFKTDGNPEALFYLGMIAEHKQEWLAALDYYTQSANKQFAEAMYRAGVLYQQDRLSSTSTLVIKKDETKELLWYRKGAALYSAHALHALSTASQTSAAACIHLAQLYEQGEGLYKSQKRMVEFYRKADELGDNTATIKLGEWNEKGLSDIMSKDDKQAYLYYLKAAQRAYQLALAPLEKIAQRLADKEIDYTVGNVLKDVFKNTAAALSWYKKSVDKGYAPANTVLQELANSTPQQAYDIGLLYEKDVSPNISQALRYYMMAAKKEHAASKNKIESLATSGNVEALYVWGYEYYHQHKGNTLEAVKWCVRAAEKNYTQAVNYINNTAFSADIYLRIAGIYETGEGITKNITRAAEFLTKASNAGKAEANFKLGQWYENGNPPSIAKDLKKASQYYLKAAQQNYPGALAALERLVNTTSDAQLEFEIGNLYQNVVKNISTSLTWYKKAADKNHTQATTLLQQIAANNAQHAYEIGYQYENNSPANLAQAMRYYLIAAKKEHASAKSRLETLANSAIVMRNICGAMIITCR
jgi:TPR repeat protein